jgi:hypothetical protein
MGLAGEPEIRWFVVRIPFLARNSSTSGRLALLHLRRSIVVKDVRASAMSGEVRRLSRKK